MTDDQWQKIAFKLQRKIRSCRSKAKNAPTLDRKLDLLAQVKELLEQLRQHRLHNFDLVDNES